MKRTDLLRQAPQRALIVTMRFLGDALLSTPLARALKQRHSACRIDVLTFTGTEAAFEGNADIERVLAVPEESDARQTMKTALELRRSYDLAVVAQTGTRPFFFGWAAGRRRVGLVAPELGRSWWKRALFDGYAVFDPLAPRVLENQRLAELLGIDALPAVVPPSAGWTSNEVGAALGFPATERFAIVHPSPRWRYKQWTAVGWRALVAALADAGLRVVITGGPGDAEKSYLDDVLGTDPVNCLRVDGRWSFAQTADVLQHAALYVGPDTATTHLAAACGTPTVALYGPTDPAIWGPWPARDGREYGRVAAHQRRGNVLLLQNPDLGCVPCQLEGCERHRQSYSLCLDRLPAGRIVPVALAQARGGTEEL
ncbi:MAG TPA: glycosyltransferase family 9 protein [Burkholderiaceae bacterium]|nr:glycosyltransferase family 9 protein [Burkholderiaceae bacterium]